MLRLSVLAAVNAILSIALLILLRRLLDEEHAVFAVVHYANMLTIGSIAAAATSKIVQSDVASGRNVDGAISSSLNSILISVLLCFLVILQWDWYSQVFGSAASATGSDENSRALNISPWTSLLAISQCAAQIACGYYYGSNAQREFEFRYALGGAATILLLLLGDRIGASTTELLWILNARYFPLVLRRWKPSRPLAKTVFRGSKDNLLLTFFLGASKTLPIFDRWIANQVGLAFALVITQQLHGFWGQLHNKVLGLPYLTAIAKADTPQHTKIKHINFYVMSLSLTLLLCFLALPDDISLLQAWAMDLSIVVPALLFSFALYTLSALLPLQFYAEGKTSVIIKAVAIGLPLATLLKLLFSALNLPDWILLGSLISIYGLVNYGYFLINIKLGHRHET